MHLSLIIDGVIVFDNFMLICTTKLAAATRCDVPSDMMYGPSSRRHSACMHGLHSVPRTQSMYALQRCSAAPLYPTLPIYDFLVSKSKLHSNVPSDMMYARSSRRDSAFMHRLPFVPRTQYIYGSSPTFKPAHIYTIF